MKWEEKPDRIKVGMVALAFNPITQEEEATDLCELKASLVYTASSRTVRAK